MTATQRQTCAYSQQSSRVLKTTGERGNAALVLLTVKSLKTRFREPRRRAMRAALGWFTIALGFCCAGVLLPASDEVLQRQRETVKTHQYSHAGPESLGKEVHTGKKTGWDSAPAALLVLVQPAKPLWNSVYPKIKTKRRQKGVSQPAVKPND